MRTAESAVDRAQPAARHGDPRRAARAHRPRCSREVKKIPDDAEAYRAAIVDWVAPRRRLAVRAVAGRGRRAVAAARRRRGRGGGVLRARPAPAPHRRARRRRAVVAGGPRARPGQLDVQAPGLDAGHHGARGATENDLIQGPNDVYAGNWLDDVVAGGGGRTHVRHPSPGSEQPRGSLGRHGARALARRAGPAQPGGAVRLHRLERRRRRGVDRGPRTSIEGWGATALAEIDPEAFTDFATIRPHVRLNDGLAARSSGRRSGVWSRVDARRRRDPRARPGAGAALAAVLPPARRASPSRLRRAARRSAWAPCSPTCRTAGRSRSSAPPATPS